MARFFIPDLGYRAKAGKDIKKDVLFDLNNVLPSDAFVCLGMTIGHREVDLVIFTDGFVHVVEVKDKYQYPVKFFVNKGLLIKKSDGEWEPIVNDRNLGEYANVQAEKCAKAVAYGFSKIGINIKTSPYILIPHPFPGSDVSENADYVWMSLSVDELITNIHMRENQLFKRGQLNHYSKSDLEQVIKNRFNLHETCTIQGYRIGDPVPPFDRKNPYGSKSQLIKIMFTLGVLLIRFGIIGFLGFAFLSILLQKNVIQNMLLPIIGVVSLGLLFFVSVKLIILLGKEKIDRKKHDTASNVFISPIKPDGDNLVVLEQKEQDDSERTINHNVPKFLKEDSLNSKSIHGKLDLKSKPSTKQSLKPFFIVLSGVFVVLLLFVIFGTSFQKVCSKVDHLNIRSQPNGEVVGTFAKGDCFYTSGISRDYEWIQIGGIVNHGNWVSIQFVDEINIERLKIKE